MNDVLKIFISHKMPADTPLAQEIGEKLGIYAGDRIKVVHAGQFPAGDMWRSSIERELDEAHWVILLHTDQDSDWNFCMFECGYFRARMKNEPQTRLIAMCKDLKYLSDAVKEFNAVQVNAVSAKKLLEEIYLEEPWQLSRKLGQKELEKTAEGIVDVYEGSQRVEENFDVATNVTLEVTLTDKTKSILATQRIPPDAIVTGNSGWQQLFGRLPDSSGWVWSTLIDRWPYKHIYEYLIANMINNALEKHQPIGIFLRSPPDGNALFRLTLRRYEVMKNNKHRFHFTAVPLDLPFDLPIESSREEMETILYNLINLTWYFRRRLIDRIYDRVLDLLSTTNPDQANVENLYREIGQELMQIQAQSIIRKIDNPRILKNALGPKDSEALSLVKRSKEYNELEKNIFDAIPKGLNGLRQIAENLYKMAIMNYEWYKRASTGYAKLAQELPPPPAPDSE